MAAIVRAPAPAARPRLERSMGLWMATALVVGNMIGSGVFLLPASPAQAAGPISILGWVFTGAGAMLLALVFANLGRALPRTGGPYAYARRAFGDFIGFQTAWGYWIAVWAGNAAIAAAFVGYAAVFWPKFVPLAAIGVIGLFFIHGGNYTPFAPPRLGGGHQLRGHADAVGLHRARVRDGPGGRGHRPGAHDPAGHADRQGFVLMLAGVPVYIGMRWWQRRGEVTS